MLYAISTGIVSINISCYLRSFYYRTLPGICYLKSAIILQNVCSSYATIFSEMAVMISQNPARSIYSTNPSIPWLSTPPSQVGILSSSGISTCVYHHKKILVFQILSFTSRVYQAQKEHWA